MDKTIAFNQDQIDHIMRVQENVFKFCSNIIKEGIRHDESKFSKVEYDAFINSRDSLNASRDGKDEEYQKNLNSKSIQHHINENPHHPEYWNTRKKEMPIEQVIIMFFDWYSRCQQKETSMDDFWDYNLAKLETQPKAKAVVSLLKSCVGKG